MLWWGHLGPRVSVPSRPHRLSEGFFLQSPLGLGPGRDLRNLLYISLSAAEFLRIRECIILECCGNGVGPLFLAMGPFPVVPKACSTHLAAILHGSCCLRKNCRLLRPSLAGLIPQVPSFLLMKQVRTVVVTALRSDLPWEAPQFGAWPYQMGSPCSHQAELSSET